MRFFRQIIRLFMLCCMGELIAMMLPFPFPGSVLALILLFLCLIFKVIKPEQVNIVSDFLLKNMAFVFLPSTVSIIAYLDVFQDILWKFLFICIVTTVITFFCTAYAVKFTIYLMNRRKDDSSHA